MLTWREAMSLRDELPSPAECRDIRCSAGLTLAQLGAEIGVSAAAVRLWETGSRFPRGSHLKSYVRLLDEIGRRLDRDSDA